MKELGRGNDGLGLVEVLSTHSSTTADETGTIIAHTPGFFSMYHSVITPPPPPPPSPEVSTDSSSVGSDEHLFSPSSALHVSSFLCDCAS